jgi:two-component system, OmpR family, response regulator
MRILVLGGDGQDVAAIENAIRLGNVEILRPGQPLLEAGDESRYAFAGWTLDAATRDLVNAAGGRVDLTSSEFDLLMAFIRQPGKALSRSALTTALRGRAWTYFDRSLDTLVARLRKKIDVGADPTLIRSVRGVGYVFCATVSHAPAAERPAAA